MRNLTLTEMPSSSRYSTLLMLSPVNKSQTLTLSGRRKYPTIMSIGRLKSHRLTLIGSRKYPKMMSSGRGESNALRERPKLNTRHKSPRLKLNAQRNKARRNKINQYPVNVLTKRCSNSTIRVTIVVKPNANEEGLQRKN